ncbi:hypothetical protein [Actinoplanes sp. CA-252034]|uniref:hypothetical protein n=1 Tax=Actinoplanes sp. CA-252034 TaxID=3239906 RepID=UPI003D98AA07
MLVTAFVMAPTLLVAYPPGTGFASEPALAAAVRQAVAEYWQSGAPEFPPALTGLVDYWLRYHLVKAVTAGLLVVVLAAIVVRAARRPLLAALAAVPALFAVALVMANVQGMVAPFASLLPMLVDGGSPSAPLEPVRDDLAGSLTSGAPPAPAVEAMITDFARYHVAMVVIAAVVAVALAGLSRHLWRRGGGRRWWAVGPAAVALPLVVIAVANATTAADPAPALLAFLNGGW